jgi:uncharacterized protein (UPF0332 family)
MHSLQGLPCCRDPVPTTGADCHLGPDHLVGSGCRGHPPLARPTVASRRVPCGWCTCVFIDQDPYTETRAATAQCSSRGDDDLIEDQQELLEKARSIVAAAKLLLGVAYPDFAATRVYYAIFYIAQAFLDGEGLAFSKHSAVIDAFGRHFAHTGKVSAEIHRFLLTAQDLCHGRDYGPPHAVTLD